MDPAPAEGETPVQEPNRWPAKRPSPSWPGRAEGGGESNHCVIIIIKNCVYDQKPVINYC